MAGQLYYAGLVPPWQRPAAMLTSLAGHALVTSAVFLFVHFAPTSEQVDLSSVRYMNLKLSGPLYYRPDPPPPPAEKPAAKAPGQKSRGAAVQASKAGLPLPPAVGIRIPTHLELPSLPKASDVAPVIMQPDLQVNTPLPMKAVPSMAFWAKQVTAPKPPPKQFVAPGRVEKVAGPAPKLDAAPSLKVPNRQTNPGNLNFSMPQPQKPPALAVANSTTVPVRIPTQTNNTNAGAIEKNEGEAANIIAISPNRLQMTEMVTVPKGFQNLPAAGDGTGPPRPGGSGSTSANARNATGNGGNAASGAGTATGTNGTNAGAGAGGAGKTGTADAGGKTAGNGGGGSGNASGVRDGTGTGAGPGTGGTGEPNRLAASASPAAGGSVTEGVTRIVHPVTGNFDVVIMQSSARDDLLDTGGMLSGNPVYTVYLRVGDSKEWLMEYCVPARENARNNAYEVYVGDATPVTAPFPISTVVPNSVLGQTAREKNIIFHGYLTTAGDFRAMDSRDQSTAARQIASLLAQWKFRPALKDKVPTEVEILLVVPARI